MTDFLTINARPYPVAVQGATENAPSYSGEDARSFNNTHRSTKDPATKKRQWGFALGPMLPTGAGSTYATLLADTDASAVVPIGGDAITGGPVDAIVSVTGQYVKDGSGHKMVAIVVIDEA